MQGSAYIMLSKNTKVWNLKKQQRMIKRGKQSKAKDLDQRQIKSGMIFKNSNDVDWEESAKISLHHTPALVNWLL